MQPTTLPLRVFAIVLTATLMLFLAGLVAARLASEGTHPTAPAEPFLLHSP